jgi:regulator of protease activity HflC (stomatin/prohibitin superfamily)
VLAVVLLIALVVAYSTFFTVYQTRQALVVRLGEPVRVIIELGLNAKIPCVACIDKRILNIESVIASASPSSNFSAATVARFRAPLGRPSGLPLCPGLKVI